MRSASSSSTASARHDRRVSTRVDWPRSSAASSLRMSPGSEMNTGPVGGVIAILAARRTMRGRSVEPRHLDRPFDERLGHAHERRIEQRLGQAVALLLLAGGQDHRRAGEARVEERAHRVAEARRDVHVAGDELARGARVAVGHRDHERLLQAEHEVRSGWSDERVHDRQFGGARIAEQMRDAFGAQQLQEGLAARYRCGHRHGIVHAGPRRSLADPDRPAAE